MEVTQIFLIVKCYPTIPRASLSSHISSPILRAPFEPSFVISSSFPSEPLCHPGHPSILSEYYLHLSPCHRPGECLKHVTWVIAQNILALRLHYLGLTRKTQRDTPKQWHNSWSYITHLGSGRTGVPTQAVPPQSWSLSPTYRPKFNWILILCTVYLKFGLDNLPKI